MKNYEIDEKQYGIPKLLVCDCRKKLSNLACHFFTCFLLFRPIFNLYSFPIQTQILCDIDKE